MSFLAVGCSWGVVSEVVGVVPVPPHPIIQFSFMFTVYCEKASSSNLYSLRSNSPDLKSITASSSSTKGKSLNITNIPSSPISKCPSCQNVESIRNLHVTEALKEFTEKLENFKQINKNLQDNTSCMDHAVNAIKHFILKFDTNSMDNFLKTSVKNIEIIKGNLEDFNNYIAKLDDIEYRVANVEEFLRKSSELDKKLMRENSKLDEIEKYIHNKLESIDSFTQVSSESKDQNMLHKINNLNQLCNELNEKIDNSRHTTHHRSPQIADLEDFITTKINSLESSYFTDNVTLTNRISKLEELCNNLNRKFDSFTIQRPPNTHCNPIPQVTSNASRQFTSNTTSFSPSNERHQASNHHITQGSTYPTSTTPRDLLILGDSNCKYIKIDNSHIRTTRIPTYRIGDVNPENCIRYSRVWINVGINDLKTRNCRGSTDVHMYHKLLFQKLHRISQVCLNSKLIVSPILPTGVPALNDRLDFLLICYTLDHNGLIY